MLVVAEDALFRVGIRLHFRLIKIYFVGHSPPKS